MKTHENIENVLDSIIDNYINGNHLDCKKQITKLNKAELLTIVSYAKYCFNNETLGTTNNLLIYMGWDK